MTWYQLGFIIHFLGFFKTDINSDLWLTFQEAMLAGADSKLSDIAFEYGRNVGIAFQLVDDMLDFISSSDAMGKPTAADLKLGLATAPVLFACEKVRYSNYMYIINRLYSVYPTKDVSITMSYSWGPTIGNSNIL